MTLYEDIENYLNNELYITNESLPYHVKEILKLIDKNFVYTTNKFYDTELVPYLQKSNITPVTVMLSFKAFNSRIESMMEPES